MILISRKSNKIAGSVFILFGIICIFYLFFSQRLIIGQHSFFVARYFKVILAVYGGLFGIVSGVLLLIGFLTPYYEANPYEKAKINVLGSIFSAPLFVFMLIVTSTSIRITEIRSYMILGIIFSCIMIVVSVWTFISSLNTLKKIHKKK